MAERDYYSELAALVRTTRAESPDATADDITAVVMQLIDDEAMAFFANEVTDSHLFALPGESAEQTKRRYAQHPIHNFVARILAGYDRG